MLCENLFYCFIFILLLIYTRFPFFTRLGEDRNRRHKTELDES